MIINIKLQDEKIIGYRTFPIDLTMEYVEVDQIPLDILSGNYTYKNHKLYKLNELESIKEQNDIPSVSYKLKDLQNAFKKYKSDVIYGILFEDEETHNKILNWYKNLINSDTPSVTLVPSEILKYLEEDK